MARNPVCASPGSRLVTPPLSTRLVAALLLVAMAASLGACGRKGALEPEPGSPAVSAPPSDEETRDQKGAPARRGPPRPFPLDPML